MIWESLGAGNVAKSNISNIYVYKSYATHSEDIRQE